MAEKKSNPVVPESSVVSIPLSLTQVIEYIDNGATVYSHDGVNHLVGDLLGFGYEGGIFVVLLENIGSRPNLESDYDFKVLEGYDHEIEIPIDEFIFLLVDGDTILIQAPGDEAEEIRFDLKVAPK